MRIWKYNLQASADRQELLMPKGAKILTIQPQYENLCLWALCDEEEERKESRIIATYETGHPISGTPGEYIGTYQMYGGFGIFHVFDKGVENV
jgi:hypothetical protein